MADHDTAITLLYADFPGLGDRWELDTAGTSAAVARVHAAFNAIVTSYLGEFVPALVDARCARFVDAGAAVAAAVAFRREVVSANELRVQIALAAGPPWPDGETPIPLYNRVRALAERLRAGQLLLTKSVGDQVASSLPAGTHLRRSVRIVPGAAKLEHVMLLDDDGRVCARAASSGCDIPNTIVATKRVRI